MQKLMPLVFLIMSLGCHRSSIRTHSEFIEPLCAPILTIDPACAHDTDSMQVAREIFEPLFRIDSEGHVEPYLVEKYQILSKQRIFVFHLKPKVFFHNGQELTSKDLKWTIQRNLNLSCHNTKTKNIFNYLKRIDTPTKYMIKLVFNEPKPYFISQLTTLNSAPIAMNSTLLNKEMTQLKQIVGTGPYCISHYQPNALIQLKSFSFYHGEKSINQFIKRPLILEPQIRLNLFIKKQADKIMLPRTMIETIKKNKELSQYCKIIPRLSTTYLAIGIHSHPNLKEKQFRKALLGWIPLNSLQEEITLNTVSLAKNFVPYKIPDYFYSNQLPIQSTKELENILSQQGYSLKKPLIINLHFRADNIGNQRLAEILAREWNQCRGLKIDLKPCQRYKFHVAQETQKMNLFITRWLADYPDPQHGLECFKKNNPQNYCGFYDDHYDSLLNIATNTSRKKTRYQICKEAEGYILDQAVLLPLTHDSEIELIQPYVKGFKTNPIFDLSYNLLSLERGSKTY